MLVIVFIFFMLVRQLQVGGGKAMSFGKSRARLLTENKNKVTFKDVAGVKEAKEELLEMQGVVNDDSVLAAFVSALHDSGVFQRVDLKSSSQIPDGKRVAFVKGADLFMVETRSARVSQLTFDGSDVVRLLAGRRAGGDQRHRAAVHHARRVDTAPGRYQIK